MNSLHIRKAYPPIKYPSPPSLRARKSPAHNPNVNKVDSGLTRHPPVFPKCERAGRFILHQDIALAVTVPIRHVNAYAWTGDIERDAETIAPFGRRVVVGKYFIGIGVAIIVDPDVIV